MAECPTPVIMLSALTGEGADTTVKALAAGAVDFFLKASTISPSGTSESSEVLITKIKQAARTAAATYRVPLTHLRSSSERRVEMANCCKFADDHKIVIIGSSTGGPRALMQVVPMIPSGIQAAFMIVQHMPPVFTKSLADRLDRISQIPVREVGPGDMLKVGQAYLAPGGYHMTVSKGHLIRLNQEPPVWGVRPSVDITMKSAAEAFGGRVTGVILTGMGCDGTAGAAEIKKNGGKILAEDESTCAVFGMPQSAAKARLVDWLLPLPEIAPRIIAMCGVAAAA
jgi:two-component system chemotaxis response regulator CheB